MKTGQTTIVKHAVFGVLIGMILGTQIFFMQRKLVEEPKSASAQTGGNVCYQDAVDGACPGGWTPVGSGCYADGTTICTCDGGLSGLCGAGTCTCLPCDLETGGTNCPSSTSSSSPSSTPPPPPCDPSEVTCYDLIATDFYCCASGETCGTPNGCVPPTPPPPPPPSSSSTSSSSENSSDPCASSTAP